MPDGARAWREACAALGCDASAADAAWREIAAAYGEPWRHYHTMRHIDSLAVSRRAHAAAFADPVTVDLAIVLHDVVYDSARSDNEAASAVWARARLEALGAGHDRIGMVARMIEASRHDGDAVAAIDPASDLAAFLDLDHSILAADGADYDAYAAAIRREYAIYADEAYRAGRIRVLEGFLGRPAIYRSTHFAPLWEKRARAGIAAELLRLTGP